MESYLYWAKSMKIVFKKIPKIAQILYVIGLILIAFALFRYFNFKELSSAVLTQQLFILGAIIVATTFAMTVVPNIPDADRAHEIKLEAADVDIVIIVACGERAGEVVETITEFPNMPDPKGGTLMDRTIIICNTSSMPVAAREASIYTGLTLAEYYRQMGYNALLIADSTSRWAQAMRETSGRLEEIPGEEAFPAYLDSSVRALYERAGVIQNNAGQQGTLTMIGTVSPAGGNFEEPVTQSTLRAVKTFLGLSADRAYKRAYPAIDPLLSWSRYTDQVSGWYTSTLGDDWLLRVSEAQQWLRDAQAIEQMMQVTGEEGVTLEDYCTFVKAKFLDEVFLQQDAFDTVDASTPMSRQNEQLRLIQRVMDSLPAFDDKAAAQHYFMRITGLFKNLNYSAENSPDYATFKAQLFSK